MIFWMMVMLHVKPETINTPVYLYASLTHSINSLSLSTIEIFIPAIKRSWSWASNPSGKSHLAAWSRSSSMKSLTFQSLCCVILWRFDLSLHSQLAHCTWLSSNFSRDLCDNEVGFSGNFWFFSRLISQESEHLLCYTTHHMDSDCMLDVVTANSVNMN